MRRFGPEGLLPPGLEVAHSFWLDERFPQSLFIPLSDIRKLAESSNLSENTRPELVLSVALLDTITLNQTDRPDEAIEVVDNPSWITRNYDDGWEAKAQARIQEKVDRLKQLGLEQTDPPNSG